jgi:hypothetical protein
VGFYFRKSKKFGPFRLNLSKSGIGVSAGVKGFRVSTGPRGTYLNAGRKGLYYRTKLSGKNPRSAPPVDQQTATALAIVFIAVACLVVLGVISIASPPLGAGLLIAATIGLAVYGFQRHSLSAEIESPAPPALNIQDNPEQAVVAALLVCVDGSKVSTEVLCKGLGVSPEDAALLIERLKDLGVVFEKDDYRKDLILRDRAYLVAQALHASNFTRHLDELRQPPPHIVLGVKAGALAAEVLTAYKQKRALYSPTKISQLEPEVQALANLRIWDIEDARSRMLAGRK